MSLSSFALALKFTLFAEGGYSDNSADSGGPTNYGITQGTWDAYTAAQGLVPSPVDKLPLSTAKAIYQHMYWEAGHCPELPEKLAICHFDWCVNHGVGGAALTLQEALGVPQDGDIGPITLAAAAKCDILAVLAKYLALRRIWYITDVDKNHSQEVFLGGWLCRVDNLRDYLGTLHG